MSELTKEQIKNLVTNFYQKVRADELLGPVFDDVAKVDWEYHIPLLCEFWNSIMLKTNEYQGNAFAKHVILGNLTEISSAHFDRWLNLFEQEAKQWLPDDAAQEIVMRAHMISEVLKRGMKI